MIKTILTPIDGSAHAQAALEFGIDLAAKYDAELVLLHVIIRDGHVVPDLYEAATRELEEADKSGRDTGLKAHLWHHVRILDYMGNMLLRKAEEQAKAGGVARVETAMESGDAGECILQHANNRSADLIVMGSRGFSNLVGLVLGSVSHQVFHLAHCSCVTVHREEDQPAFAGMRKILVPTDGSEQADRAVELASDIAAKYDSELILAYVTWRGPSLEKLRDSVDLDRLSENARDELDPDKHPIAEHMSSALMPPVISKDTSTEIGEQVLERGRQSAEAKGVANIRPMLLDGDPARAIAGIAEHEQADLIAMGSRGLGGFEGLLSGSVSYKISHSVSCSFMIIR